MYCPISEPAGRGRRGSTAELSRRGRPPRRPPRRPQNRELLSRGHVIKKGSGGLRQTKPLPSQTKPVPHQPTGSCLNLIFSSSVRFCFYSQFILFFFLHVSCFMFYFLFLCFLLVLFLSLFFSLLLTLLVRVLVLF